MNLPKILATGLLIAVASVPVMAKPTVRVGTLTEISDKELWLKEAEIRGIGSHALITFNAGPKAQADLAGVKVGQEVRIVLENEPGQSASKLVSIRLCRPKEQECARIHSRKQTELARYLRENEVSQRKLAACTQAMDISLRKSFPDLPAPDAEKQPAIEQSHAINALQGQERLCVDDFMQRYQQAYFNACEQQHCGDGIGGGCYHIAGNWMHEGVLGHALRRCTSPASEAPRP